jgi:primosomal protein N''
LFNLAEDPGEQIDLAERLPARVEQLDRQLAGWQTEANARMPRPNPDFDPSQPPLKDKDFSRSLAMKERAVFERRLRERLGRPSGGARSDKSRLDDSREDL